MEDADSAMNVVSVRVVRDEVARSFDLPVYATAHSAGVDLRASEEAILAPGQRLSVGTGLRIELPEGFEAQIRPRSGLALKKGITLLNSPGTIDSDYRGEIRVIMANLGETPFIVKVGDRIAQMIVAPVVRLTWVECEDLSETDRGSGGFGSTGI